MMMLKSLYELGDYDSSKYIIDSIKHYISRSRNINRFQVQMNKNFIKLYLMLLQKKTGRNISGQKIIDLMDETPGYIPNRSWLIEKIEEFE